MPKKSENFRVIVGNIGTTYDGPNLVEAKATYWEYVALSRDGYGRASHESVTLLRGEEIYLEHTPELHAQES